jgi:hypothetical protein
MPQLHYANLLSGLSTMPKVKHNDSSIQLQCTLCPKTPQFSDVSHLLTHIASKSHLSHRFKLQIRAQSESAARQQLDNFDQWYRNNNLDVLLSGRMAAKEQKKSVKQKKGGHFQTSKAFVSNFVQMQYSHQAEIVELLYLHY